MIYGHDKTIHGTQDVNIERSSETGKVVAVWFRCALLPFTDTLVGPSRTASMQEAYQKRPKGILAVEFSEDPAPMPEDYELRGAGLHPRT